MTNDELANEIQSIQEKIVNLAKRIRDDNETTKNDGLFYAQNFSVLVSFYVFFKDFKHRFIDCYSGPEKQAVTEELDYQCAEEYDNYLKREGRNGY